MKAWKCTIFMMKCDATEHFSRFDLSPDCTRGNEFFMKWNFFCSFPPITASYIIIETIKNVVCKQISLNFFPCARDENSRLLNSCSFSFFVAPIVLTFTASRFSRFLVCQWQLIIYSGHELEKFFRGLNRAILIDGVLKMLSKISFNDFAWLHEEGIRRRKWRCIGRGSNK